MINLIKEDTLNEQSQDNARNSDADFNRFVIASRKENLYFLLLSHLLIFLLLLINTYYKYYYVAYTKDFPKKAAPMIPASLPSVAAVIFVLRERPPYISSLTYFSTGVVKYSF